MTQSLFSELNMVTLPNESGLSVTSGMDKTKDFQKVFDAKNSELSTQDSPSTIGDLKNTTIATATSADKLSELIKILEQVSGETKEESALDLTLARDMDEIISQLKSSLDDAKDTKSEDSSDGSVVIDTSLLFEQILSGMDDGNNNVFDLKQDLSSSVEFVDESLENTDSLDIVNDKVLELVSDAVGNGEQEGSDSSMDISLDDEIVKELNIESIEADADSTSSGDSPMNKQSAEEHSVKVMLNNDAASFDLNVEKMSESQSVQSQTKPVAISSSKIIEQVAKQMEGLYNNSKVSIVLNPESLGKINIQLMNTKDGLTAQFTVTTPEAKDMLMKGVDGLRESLTAHGVSVDNVSIKLNDSQKGDNNQNWTEQDGSRGGNKGQSQSNKEEKEKGLFAKMMAETNNEENGNV